jgi:hypothetical protein
MDSSRAEELETLLGGVPLPAGKAELLAYAVQQRAEPLLLGALRGLPDRQYAEVDEVVAELVRNGRLS